MYSFIPFLGFRPKPVPEPAPITDRFSFTTKLLLGIAVIGAGWFTLNTLTTVPSQRKRVDWEGACRCPYCTHPVDIIIISLEGSTFGAHTLTLGLYNDKFPQFRRRTDRGCTNIRLDQTSETVRLLLLFSHNTTRPNLEHESLDTVLALAHVAKRYENRVAFKACTSVMSTFGRKSPTNALRVLCFNVSQHDYQDVDALARLSMQLSALEAVPYMREYKSIYMVWSQYKEAWDECTRKVNATLSVGVSPYNLDTMTLYDVQLAFIRQIKSESVLSSEGIDRALKLSMCFSHPESRSEALNWVTQRARELKKVVVGYPVWEDYM